MLISLIHGIRREGKQKREREMKSRWNIACSNMCMECQINRFYQLNTSVIDQSEAHQMWFFYTRTYQYKQMRFMIHSPGIFKRTMRNRMKALNWLERFMIQATLPYMRKDNPVGIQCKQSHIWTHNHIFAVDSKIPLAIIVLEVKTLWNTAHVWRDQRKTTNGCLFKLMRYMYPLKREEVVHPLI